ncbi:hypothetical protein ANAPH2_00326 [Anaplasma phagocytophilum]|nr:hypothetical protein ANAPH2_00326 [Anaplasma phagocytophilum]
MMLLLGRLITLLLLLLKPLVKTSFSLVRLLIFLILISMRRFVRRRRIVDMATINTRRIIVKLRQKQPEKVELHYAETRGSTVMVRVWGTIVLQHST